jgi:hypothetical protein
VVEPVADIASPMQKWKRFLRYPGTLAEPEPPIPLNSGPVRVHEDQARLTVTCVS